MPNYDLLYRDCKAASYEKNESEDCTVRAIAITTGEGYDLAHYAMEEQGRKRGRGTSIANMKRVCDQLGYKMVRVERQTYAGRAKTIITAARWGWKGAFIISTRGHVAGMVDGKVYDWADGTRKRINNIYRITTIEEYRKSKKITLQ